MADSGVSPDGLKTILLCKVWKPGPGFEQTGTVSTETKTPTKLSKLLNKVQIGSTTNDPYPEDEASLLLLTCDYISIIDSQVHKRNREEDLEAVTYFLPLGRVKSISVEGRRVDINYLMPNFYGSLDIRSLSNNTGVRAGDSIFGVLSHPKLAAVLPRNSIQTEEDSFTTRRKNGIDVMGHFILESEKDAQGLEKELNLAMERYAKAISWLDAGLPFRRSPVLSSVVVGNEDKKPYMMVSSSPKIGTAIEVSMGPDCGKSIIITVSTPMGPFRGTISSQMLEKLIEISSVMHEVARAEPISPELNCGMTCPSFSVDIEYRLQRLSDTHASKPWIDVPGHFGSSIVSLLLSVMIPAVDHWMYTLSCFVFILISLILFWGAMSNGAICLVLSKSVAVRQYSLTIENMEVVEEPDEAPPEPDGAGQPDSENRELFSRRLSRFATMHQPSADSKLVNFSHVSMRRSIVMSNINGAVERIEEQVVKSVTVEVDSTRISSKEALILRELHEISPAINADLYRRYIAACKGDRQLAMSRLRSTANWRAEHSVDSILTAPIPYFNLLKSSYVHAVIGRTRSGLPVVVEGMGSFKKTMVTLREKGIVPGQVEEVIHQFVFVMEWITRALDATPYPRGQFVRIYDMKGIGFSDIADSEAVHLGKQMMDVLEHHYPERMAKAYVINVPGFFGAVWKMIRPMLDPNTSKKIRVVSKFKKILPSLREEMDDEVIPQAYGGKGISRWYDSEEERSIHDVAERANAH